MCVYIVSVNVYIYNLESLVNFLKLWTIGITCELYKITNTYVVKNEHKVIKSFTMMRGLVRLRCGKDKAEI
jgi:hypothetical protein